MQATSTVWNASAGRSSEPAPLTSPPVPPVIDEPTARLVYSAIGLPELFMKRAGAMKMLVEAVRVEDVLEQGRRVSQEQKCQKIMLSDTQLLTQLDAVGAVERRAG